MEEKVVLVDKKDREIGTCEKMKVHKTGELHRAVSVIIFNSKAEMLLQQRAVGKYHSGGLWSNAACTHPRPNENNIDAAKRRLKEEMGIEAELEEKMTFIYKAFLDNQLVENEFDHVFLGVTNQFPTLNPDEVMDYKYVSYLNLITDIELFPEKYTVWFKIILKEAEKHIKKFIAELS